MTRKSQPAKQFFSPLLAGLLCFTASLKAADDTAGIRAALVPAANLAVMVNWRALRSASIMPSTLDLLRSQGKNRREEKQQFEKLAQDILGLTPEDLVGLVYSVDLSPLFQDGQLSEPDPNTLPMCGGLRLAKPVTLDAISELMRESAEQQDKTVEMLRKQHGADSLLIVREKAPEGMPPAAGPQGAMKAVRMVVAVPGEGTAVFFGTEKGVAGALDRYHAGTVIRPSDALLLARKLVPAGSQFLALIVPPEGVRAMMQQQAGSAEEPPANPMMGMMGMFSGMKGLSLALHAQDTLDLFAHLALSSPQEAQQVQMMMQNMVLGSARSKLPRSEEGEELAAAQSMQVRAQGSGVLFRMSVSEEDIQMFEGGALRPPEGMEEFPEDELRPPEGMEEIPEDAPRPLIF